MELKESVIMDITEAFRNEDITKTDFFDFVVTPDSNDTHSIQQFSKQMRSVNAFLGSVSPDGKEANNNNNNSHNNNNNNNNNMLCASATELAHLPVGTAEAGGFDANSFWNDKETVRIETAILEDLNKYCWSTEDGKATANDGQIYTLTVLNGIDHQNASWYRPSLASLGIVKEEDVSISSPGSMEHLQGGLDIESILSIIPGQMNGFHGNYSESTMSPNTDGLIKSETYTYEDSGFADNKDELANSLIIDTPLLEAHDSFNNNNNDWKLTNNNHSNNNNTTSHNNNIVSNGSPDSLLRSALQGKAFVRYNGGTSKTSGNGNSNNNNNNKENNAELRRVLSTPPTKTEPIFKEQENEQQHIPTIVAGIDANGKVVFEEHRTGDDGTTGGHNVDDLLLSQLDQSFPEDFEKLKRIANEVAESVNQYCQIDTSEGATPVYSISPDQIGMLGNLSSPIQITAVTPATVVTSTKPTTTKKYKRSNSGTKTQTTVQNATSTSNGVRKERSLHYCSICSKGFKDKYSVNVHIRTHTGEKPFACSLCGKSFRQKAHLAKHYQTHIAQKNAAAAGNVSASKTKSR